MPRLIEGGFAEGGRIVDDAWVAVNTVEELRVAADGASLLVSHALWDAQRSALIARGAPLGVKLEAPDDPAILVDDLPHFTLVAVDFPKFTDGRGYSIARKLRERYGFQGRLRAVGDVLRDQLFYMLRCGFDSFAMKHEERIDEALSAYRDFSDAYQTSVERTVPLFARRNEVSA